MSTATATKPGSSSSSMRSRKSGPSKPSAAQPREFTEPPDEANIKTRLHSPNDANASTSQGPLDHELTDESFGLLHQLPLIFVLLPTLGSAVFGSAEAWTDALLLTLVCLYLYLLVRVPWDLYYSARRRRQQAVMSLSAQQHRHSDSAGGLPAGSEEEMARQAALDELRRTELLSLIMTLAAPFLGSRLLYWIKPALSQPDRYINGYSIRLFTLASGIKPLKHLFEIIQRRSLHLQNVVASPTGDEWTSLTERLGSLESSFHQLLEDAASKADVRTLKDALDVPLHDLVKAVARHERKNEVLRLNAQKRFQDLNDQLDELDRESEEHDRTIADLTEQVDEARQHWMDRQKHIQWLKVILFGSSAVADHEESQHTTRAEALRGMLHLMFLPVTAPWTMSTLFVQYASQRLFLPAPPPPKYRGQQQQPKHKQMREQKQPYTPPPQYKSPPSVNGRSGKGGGGGAAGPKEMSQSPTKYVKADLRT